MKEALIDKHPEVKEVVADCYSKGMSQQDIADFLTDNDFGVVKDRGTIRSWLQRPDVQGLIQKKITERANRILRHTDSKIEGFLTGADKISLENLLKIRREFAGLGIRVNEGDAAGALAELMALAHENPEAAEVLRDAIPTTAADFADDDSAESAA